MRKSRNSLLGIAAGLIAATAPNAYPHSATINGLTSQVFGPYCASCHQDEGDLGRCQQTDQQRRTEADSGFAPKPDAVCNALDTEWHASLVGMKPTNTAAFDAGKLRVNARNVSNSFLVDKMLGDLKLGESGDPACGAHDFVERCPGAIEKVALWIIGDAPADKFVPGDDNFGIVVCPVEQPAFAPAAIANSALRLQGESFSVERPARHATHTTVLDIDGDLSVGQIVVAASPGTESVTVTRVGDAAPLAVARGESLELELPAGVAVTLSSGDQIAITQTIRNDFWVTPATLPNPNVAARPDDPFINRTVGEVSVDFVASAVPATMEAKPFIDRMASTGLFVPPNTVGTSAGAWAPSPGTPLTGALVGLWADERVYAAAIGNTMAPGLLARGDAEPALEGYVALSGSNSPLAVVTYHCVHVNGITDNPTNRLPRNGSLKSTVSLISTAVKYGCEETLAVPPGAPGAAAAGCFRSDPAVGNDCEGVGTGSCTQGSLVAGDSPDDGRCDLIGLYW